MMLFAPQSLKFLKKARKENDLVWFANNRPEYEALIKAPFAAVVLGLGAQLQNQLPHFRFSVRSISRPMRSPENAVSLGPLKDFIACVMGPPKTSRFEMPPCFYFSVGASEILWGAGLYRPSGPQLRFIRMALEKQPEVLHRFLKSKNFRGTFQGFGKEQFVRLPCGYQVEEKYQYLLMQKSLSIHKHFTPKELCQPGFLGQLVEVAQRSLPLVSWLEQALRFKPDWRRGG